MQLLKENLKENFGFRKIFSKPNHSDVDAHLARIADEHSLYGERSGDEDDSQLAYQNSETTLKHGSLGEHHLIRISFLKDPSGRTLKIDHINKENKTNLSGSTKIKSHRDLKNVMNDLNNYITRIKNE